MLLWFHFFLTLTGIMYLARQMSRQVFHVFYDCALTILNSFYPLHTITVTNRDPHFVTPRIKALLRHTV